MRQNLYVMLNGGANLILTQVLLSKDLSSAVADGWAPLQWNEWEKLAEHIR